MQSDADTPAASTVPPTPLVSAQCPPTGPARSPRDIHFGTVFNGRFELEATLATGAMGTVYRAIDLEAGGRRVALKVLHPRAAEDKEMRARFEREAELASRLEHPHCVKVSSWGHTSDGTHYLAMSLVEGRELRSHLRGALPPRQALDILIDLLRALDHCHRAGIVHRDVKPENIMLTEGESQRAVLIDFGVSCGIACCSAVTVTERGSIIGTPQYMSPEQAAGRGDLDGRSDLYAAGIIFYEMLVGRRPYGGADIDALLRMQRTARIPRLPPGLPGDYSLLLRRLVAKSLRRRYSNAAEALRDALSVRQRLNRSSQSSASMSRAAILDMMQGSAQRRSGWLARRPWVATASVIAAGLIFGARPNGAGETPRGSEARGDAWPHASAKPVRWLWRDPSPVDGNAVRLAVRKRNTR